MANGLGFNPAALTLGMGGFNPGLLDAGLLQQQQLDPELGQQVAQQDPGFDPALLGSLGAQDLAQAAPIQAPPPPVAPVPQGGQVQGMSPQQKMLLGQVGVQAGTAIGGILDDLIFGRKRPTRNI